MSANIEQIKAMLERAGKINLLQKQKVDLDKERLQLEATVNIEKVDKSLEEAAEKYRRESYSRNILPNIDGPMPEYGGGIKDAFITGAEWQASQMPMPEDTVLFNKGVQEGRRLEREDMMHDALEGEICGRVYDHINVRFADGVCKYLEPKNISHIPADVSKYNIGDKVHIVVLKAEEDLE